MGEMPVPLRFARAFTLIELLMVLAIVGILATLVASAFIHIRKPSVTDAAARQMLDDFARARQLAISERTTVYIVFIPTNFWGSPINPDTTPWARLPASVRTSTIVTQMYGAQLTGYMMVTLHSVGDQPGHPVPRYLQTVKTLPDGSFISPIKFTALPYPATPIVIGSSYPMYGFATTSSIPFPTAAVLDDPAYAAIFYSIGGLTLPYIAFNDLGQLTSGDGTVLPYDEYIPLAYGTVSVSRDPVSKAYVQGSPTVAEVPAGGSTGSSYNLIHVDRITGRARVERRETL
jgi:prepilin-type N-terminal cleavage/methylation domain-containing protein